MKKHNQHIGQAADFLHPDGRFVSFDPAECITPTQSKIYRLLKNHKAELTDWECAFLIDVYN